MLRELVDENVKFRGVFGHRPKRGITAFLDYMRAARSTLDKYTFEIEDMIVSKDNSKASVRIIVRGVHNHAFFDVPGSGYEVQFTAAAFYQFRTTADDNTLRISDIFVVGDLDEVKRQIGALSKCNTAFAVPDTISTGSISSE